MSESQKKQKKAEMPVVNAEMLVVSAEMPVVSAKMPVVSVEMPVVSTEMPVDHAHMGPCPDGRDHGHDGLLLYRVNFQSTKVHH